LVISQRATNGKDEWVGNVNGKLGMWGGTSSGRCGRWSCQHTQSSNN